MTLEELQDHLLADPKVKFCCQQECRQIVARLCEQVPASKSARGDGLRPLATGCGGTITAAVGNLVWPEGRAA